jgi:hypothetical protein
MNLAVVPMLSEAVVPMRRRESVDNGIHLGIVVLIKSVRPFQDEGELTSL